MEPLFLKMLTSNMSRVFCNVFHFYNIIIFTLISSSVYHSFFIYSLHCLNEAKSHVLDRSGQLSDVKQHFLLTSPADIIIMYIFYIMYVIVFNCCRVAPLIATCVFVLKGVSLDIFRTQI